MVVNKRDLLKQLGIVVGSAISLSKISSAESSGTDSVDKLAVSIFPNEDLNLLAFTAFDGLKLRLYIATGTTSPDDTAETIVQLTDGGSSVHDVEWQENALQYWKDESIQSLTLNSSGAVLEENHIKDQALPGGVSFSSSEPSAGTNNLDPGGGSGDLPDWYTAPEMDIGDIHECKRGTYIGDVDFIEFCMTMLGVSPKLVTYSCTGTETPLVAGSIDTLSVTTPVGAGSTGGIDLWGGVNPENECLYWGSEAIGVCEKYCNYGELTVSTIEEIAGADIEQHLDDIAIIDDLSSIEGPLWLEAAEVIVKLIVLAVVVVIVAMALAVFAAFAAFTGAG